jgi:hypothetical protein
MRCQALLFSALSAVTAAMVAPRITPAPEPREALAAIARRQDLTTTPPATTGSLVTRTFAYYSGGNTEGLVLCTLRFRTVFMPALRALFCS